MTQRQDLIDTLTKQALAAKTAIHWLIDHEPRVTATPEAAGYVRGLIDLAENIDALHYQLANGITRGIALDANGAPHHETLDGWAGMMLALAGSLRSEAYDEIEYTGNIRELRQDLAGVEAYVKGMDQAMVASLEIITAATCRQ